MLRLVKRHPFPVVARFRHALAITYAFPRAALEPLLAPGLELDTDGDLGFAAAALVDVEGLRPAFLPARLGCRLFLVGYRIFARFRAPSGRSYRGLQVIESETDSGLLALAGGLFTRYGWRHRAVDVRKERGFLHVVVRGRSREPTLEVSADLRSRPGAPPPGSPFASWKEARRFEGPLPYTFTFEKAMRSIIVVEGRRSGWEPAPVEVTVRRCAFLEREPFAGARPVLAGAFHVEGIDYRWERGIIEPLDARAAKPRSKTTP
jgi:uncharacterized protein DUF2071